MNKGLLIAGAGLILGGGAYWTLKDLGLQKPPELPPLPPEQLQAHLVQTGQAKSTGTSPAQVMGDTAKLIGATGSAVAGAVKLVAAGKALLGINATATTMVSTAGIPASQAPAVVAAANEAASGTMAAGGTAAEASIGAAGVVATALGVAVAVAAVAFMVDIVSDVLSYDDRVGFLGEPYNKYFWQLTPEELAQYTRRMNEWRSIEISSGIYDNNPNIAKGGPPPAIEGFNGIRKNLKPTSMKQRLGFASPGNMGNVFDDISNYVDRATDTYNQYAQVLDPIRDSAIRNAIQSTQPGAPAPARPASPGSPGAPPPPSTPGLSTGAKVAIGVAGLGLLAGAIYMATGNKKKALGGGSSGAAGENNLATSTVFNGPKTKKRRTKKRK